MRKDEAEIVDGAYCRECFEEYFVICCRCGEPVDKDFVNVDEDENYYCDFCFNKVKAANE